MKMNPISTLSRLGGLLAALALFAGIGALVNAETKEAKPASSEHQHKACASSHEASAKPMHCGAPSTAKAADHASMGCKMGVQKTASAKTTAKPSGQRQGGRDGGTATSHEHKPAAAPASKCPMCG
jgi:hypothetical protein